MAALPGIRARRPRRTPSRVRGGRDHHAGAPGRGGHRRQRDRHPAGVGNAFYSLARDIAFQAPPPVGGRRKGRDRAKRERAAAELRPGHRARHGRSAPPVPFAAPPCGPQRVPGGDRGQVGKPLLIGNLAPAASAAGSGSSWTVEIVSYPDRRERAQFTVPIRARPSFRCPRRRGAETQPRGTSSSTSRGASGPSTTTAPAGTAGKLCVETGYSVLARGNLKPEPKPAK